MERVSDALRGRTLMAGIEGVSPFGCAWRVAMVELDCPSLPEADAAHVLALQALLERTIYGYTVEEHVIVPAPGTQTLAPGSLCEVCLDASATSVIAAEWGGDMGICAACDLATRPTEEKA